VTNPQGFTDAYALAARGDYLWRLTDGALAPYIGAGGQITWGWTRQNYTDDKTVVNQKTTLDNNTSNVSIAARGVVGAEWRFTPMFALYADYNLTVNIFSNNKINNSTTISNTSGGAAATTRTTTSQSVNSWFNVSTGLAQGATLGLELFF
jgi:hypothetical protein